MDDISFLFSDPRPELPDSNFWNKLLRAIPNLENREHAELLQRRLWTIRSIGTRLMPSTNGLRFAPILYPSGGYETEAEFEAMKKEHLGPYAAEISQLLRKVAGYE